MSLILLDKKIPDMELLKSSIKQNHTIVNYSDQLTEANVLDLIGNKTNLTFVYHFPGFFSLPFFHDIRDISNGHFKSRKLFFSNRLLDLFTSIKNKNGSLTIDLLSCSLNSVDFIKEVTDIETELGIDIRYSVDLTGNHNGNWILESDNVNIKEYYFNNNINNWNHVLTGAITLAQLRTFNNGLFTVTGTTYTLNNNINMSNININNIGGKFNNADYIDLLRDEIFDGNSKIIDVNFLNEGLFTINTDVPAFINAPIVKNVTVNSNGGINTDRGGIIRGFQKYFKVNDCNSSGDIGQQGGGICGIGAGNNGGNCTISNCNSSGDIGQFGGGICGSNAGFDNGVCTISNCYSSGDIGQFGGGICGSNAGDNGVCTISNCYSSGDIGQSGGGICGNRAGENDGECTISNCYSSGDIGVNGGGICGQSAGNNGKCIISNCYSSGDIGQNGGGICGSFAGDNGGECTISNCYSSGDIGANGGGICGNRAGENDGGECIISNCYSSGDIGANGGGICGGNTGDNGGECTISNCYSSGDIGANGGGICGFGAGNNGGECIISNCYSSGDIGEFGGGICGFGAGFNNGTVYVFGSYCNGKVVGSLEGTLYVNSIDVKTTDADSELTLTAITRKIDTSATTYEVNTVDYGDSWNQTDTWVVGSTTSNDYTQYPKLLIYSTNSVTKKLTINPELFKGYELAQSNSTRHIFFDNFYADAEIVADADGWHTDKTNLGFNTTNYYKLNYKLYNTITNLNLTTILNETTGIYVNSLAVDTDYGLTIGANTYTVRKTGNAPNNYQITIPGNATPIPGIDGQGFENNEIFILFGSLVVNKATTAFQDSITLSQLAEFNTNFFEYNTDTKICTLKSDINMGNINFTNANVKFSEGKMINLGANANANETFNGNGHTIDIDWTNTGLFMVDNTIANIDNAPTINNLTINSNGGIGYIYNNEVTAGGGGLMGSLQKYFKIENCQSNGDIYNGLNINIHRGGGGICGIRAGENGGNCTISNCYSSGDIGQNGGGICGSLAGEDGGNCTISNCYSSGDIGNGGGGICGSYAGINGECTISNCYSSGDIGEAGGGICGNSAGFNNGECIISNCYSSGDIGNGGGGICGFQAGENGECTISNCYSSGDIGEAGGGICSFSAGTNGECTISNCYSSGDIGVRGGGICGSFAGDNGVCTISNCYSSGDIGESGGGICASQAGENGGECIISNCYSSGDIGDFGGGICGNSAGFNNGTIYVLGSYCNGKVVGSLEGTLYVNSIDVKTTDADSELTLTAITGQIVTSATTYEVNNIDYGGSWDTTDTWVVGSTTSNDYTQYPKLLIYSTNSVTKKLTINPELFKGYELAQSNSTRHIFFDNFYTDDGIVADGWSASKENLAFTGNTYDKNIYNLYNTINGTLDLTTTLNGVYVNKFDLNVEYKLKMGANTYTIKKTVENPNKYILHHPTKGNTIIVDEDVYTDNGYLIIFGSLTCNTNTVGFVNNLQFINNNKPIIYKNKVCNKNGNLEFKWYPMKQIKYYIVHRYYGLCPKPENSVKVINNYYSDNSWDKSKSLIRYSVEAVFKNNNKQISTKVNYYN